MTDERQGEALWDALRALPRGSGIVLRHHSLGERARISLGRRIRRIARRRGLVLVVAGSERLASRIGARGFHQRSARVGSARMLRTVAAHSLPELVLARRAGADLAFLSPVFATATHPGARALGKLRFGLLARRADLPVIALGGMDARRARALGALGAFGWAGIGGLTP